MSDDTDGDAAVAAALAGTRRSERRSIPVKKDYAAVVDTQAQPAKARGRKGGKGAKGAKAAAGAKHKGGMLPAGAKHRPSQQQLGYQQQQQPYAYQQQQQQQQQQHPYYYGTTGGGGHPHHTATNMGMMPAVPLDAHAQSLEWSGAMLDQYCGDLAFAYEIATEGELGLMERLTLEAAPVVCGSRASQRQRESKCLRFRNPPKSLAAVVREADILVAVNGKLLAGPGAEVAATLTAAYEAGGLRQLRLVRKLTTPCLAELRLWGNESATTAMANNNNVVARFTLCPEAGLGLQLTWSAEKHDEEAATTNPLPPAVVQALSHAVPPSEELYQQRLAKKEAAERRWQEAEAEAIKKREQHYLQQQHAAWQQQQAAWQLHHHQQQQAHMHQHMHHPAAIGAPMLVAPVALQAVAAAPVQRPTPVVALPSVQAAPLPLVHAQPLAPAAPLSAGVAPPSSSQGPMVPQPLAPAAPPPPPPPPPSMP